MAYDRKLYAEIERMSAGDLVHFMLSRFIPGEDQAETYMHGEGYLHAKECLDKLIPGKPSTGDPPKSE